jgi:hypothetical protein
MFDSLRKSSHSAAHRKNGTNGKKFGRGRRLKFESLENRTLLTAVVPSTPASLLAHAAIVADPSPSLSAQHVGVSLADSSLLGHAPIAARTALSQSPQHVGDFAGTYWGSFNGVITASYRGRSFAVNFKTAWGLVVYKGGTFHCWTLNLPVNGVKGKICTASINGTWLSANGTWAMVKGAGGGISVTGTLQKHGTKAREASGLWQYKTTLTISGYGRISLQGKGFWNVHRVYV